MGIIPWIPLAALLTFLNDAVVGTTFQNYRTYKFEGYTYKLVFSPLRSFGEAYPACKNNGMMLAPIRHQKEFEFFQTMTTPEETAPYSGQIRLSGQRGPGMQKFVWAGDNTEVGNNYWGPGRPTSVPNKKDYYCTNLWFIKDQAFGIVDNWCIFPLPFLCRSIDPEPEPPTTTSQPNPPHTKRRKKKTTTTSFLPTTSEEEEPTTKKRRKTTTTTPSLETSEEDETTTTRKEIPTPKPRTPAPEPTEDNPAPPTKPPVPSPAPSPNPPSPGPSPSIAPHGNFTCEGKKCGDYPDDQNCRAYYTCNEDKGVILHTICPEGQLYRPDKKFCDQDKFVECGRRPLDDFKCEKCGMFPNPKDCRGVFICEDDKRLITSIICPHGLLYNHNRKTCDEAYYVICN